MGLYSVALIIGMIFASETLGAYFREGLFSFSFFLRWGGGGGGVGVGLIIGILRYVSSLLNLTYTLM